jgi:hypothetical protein
LNAIGEPARAAEWVSVSHRDVRLLCSSAALRWKIDLHGMRSGLLGASVLTHDPLR